ncbi:hypothetical protein ACHAXT_011889 [Thalassiosira profunda]
MAPSPTQDDDEDYDAFPSGGGDAPAFVLDTSSLAIVSSTRQAGVEGRGRRAGGSFRSAATTQLATDVGSTVGARKNPFLKSVTFFDPKVYYRNRRREEGGPAQEQDVASDEEQDANTDGAGSDDDDDLTFEINDLTHWDITLRDPLVDDMQQNKGGILGKLSKGFRKAKPQLVVVDYEGIVEFSSVEAGDRLVSINKKKIKPVEYSAAEAMEYMRQCLETDGVLNVTTENPEGKDIILNVTVIKPRPEMSYEDLGLVVWNWPHLCVRAINEDSIFVHTAVQETDQIAAINDIDCSKMREAAFARCVKALPTEITITLIRRKHRYTGSYT